MAHHPSPANMPKHAPSHASASHGLAPAQFTAHDASLLQDAIDDMWENDTNGLSSNVAKGKETEQQKTTNLYVNPRSKGAFFCYHEQIRHRVEHIATPTLLDLLDEFKAKGDDRDVYASQKTQHLFKEFINYVAGTEVYKRMFEWLGKMSFAKHVPSEAEALNILYNAWFSVFKRTSAESYSSGFEHVFCGEFKTGGGVNGMHNWIRYFLLDANYGQPGKDWVEFVRVVRERTGESVLLDDDTPYVASFGFRLHPADGGEPWFKPTGGFFLGTSPEFDFALYSMCYLVDYATAKVGNGQMEGTKHTFDVDGWKVDFQLFYMPRGQISSGFPDMIGKSTRQGPASPHN